MEKLANYERAELLEQIAALVARDVETLARWIALETGKPLKKRFSKPRAARTPCAAAAARATFTAKWCPWTPPRRQGRMAMTCVSRSA